MTYSFDQLNQQLLAIYRNTEPMNVAKFCYAVWEKFGKSIKINLGEYKGGLLIATVDLNIANTQSMLTNLSRYNCINWDELAVAYNAKMGEEDHTTINGAIELMTNRFKDRGTMRTFPGKLLNDLLPNSGFLADKYYQVDIGNIRQVEGVPELNTDLCFKRDTIDSFDKVITLGGKFKTNL